MNSYSNPNRSRKSRSIALLCAAKLSNLSNGSGIRLSGLPRCSVSMAWLGTLSGTLRKPSISSENSISRVGASDIAWNAWRTIVVRSTSLNVPMCGRPDGP